MVDPTPLRFPLSSSTIDDRGPTTGSGPADEASPSSGSAFRSGFVAVIGRPNVGKSTLINRLVGQKVAITAAVPQTTRTRILAILTLPQAQLVLVDTPGIHHPRHRLGRRMVEEAKKALSDADVVLFLLDGVVGVTAEDEAAAALLLTVSSPIVAGLNKIDRVDAARLAAIEDDVRRLGTFTAVVPISATAGANVNRLLEILIGLLPAGPHYFPPEMITDQPEQFMARELIREQAIHLTRDEVPHGVAVEIEEYTPRPRGNLVYIRATVHVDRDSHKKILIGREGRLLKQIGARARREIEALLGRRVYLDLWVKVSKDWRERADLIRAFYPE